MNNELKTSIEDSMKSKRKVFEENLIEMNRRMLYDFDQRLQETQARMNGNKTEIQIREASLVFSDYFRKQIQKITNASIDRVESQTMIDKIVQFYEQKLTKDDFLDFRAKYDVFSRSILKTKDGKVEEGESPLDKPLCSYIISKNFKKNFWEVFDFAAFIFPNQQSGINLPTRIASIGGGYGNDGLGLAMFLKSLTPEKRKMRGTHLFPEESIDITEKRVKASTQSSTLFYIDAYNPYYDIWRDSIALSKDKIPQEVVISNYLLDYSLPFESFSEKPDFIISIRSLYEASFNLSYWEKLIEENTQSKYFIIEGDQKNIEQLEKLFVKIGFKDIYFEKFENPRRLFAQFNKTNNQDHQS